MREVLLSKHAKRIFEDVKFSRIINNYEKDSVAHLVQSVRSIYPKKLMDTGFGTGLFESTFIEFTTTRNCLVKIPDGLTEEQVIERLNLFEGHIYTLISFNIKDVLTAYDIYRMELYGTSLIELEDKYETKDEHGNTYSKGLMNRTWDGEILRDEPKEYRRYIYSREYRDDIDLRPQTIMQSKPIIEKISYNLIV